MTDVVDTPAAGWYRDPTQRHQGRWWDGTRWSEHVVDGGVTGVDPVVTGAAAASVAASTVTGQATSAEPEVAPGWYRDPYERHDQRWWDGTGWSQHVRIHGVTTTDAVQTVFAAPAPTATDQAEPGAPRARPLRVGGGLIAFGGLLVVLAVRLVPWSLEYDMKLVVTLLGAALIVLGVFATRQRNLRVIGGLAVVPAAAVGVIAVLDLLDTSSRTVGLEGTELRETLPVGAGVWLAVMGAALALGGAVLSIFARSDPPR